MYLMELNSYGYILITILFACIFLISYRFRHTKSIFIDHASDTRFLYRRNFGIEFSVIGLIFFGFLGGYYALTAFMYLLIAIVIGYIFKQCISINVASKHVADPLLMVIAKLVAVLIITSITIGLMFDILHALLGWNFANSIFGLAIFSFICLMLGGYPSNNVIKNISVVTIVVILGYILIYSVSHVAIIDNLKTLGLSGYQDSNHYLFHGLNWNTLITIIFVVASYSSLSQSDGRHTCIPGSAAKIIGIAIFIMLGVMAICTPFSGHVLNNGSQIVTQTTQLSDGQTGYVVRAINNNVETFTPGIIPSIMHLVSHDGVVIVDSTTTIPNLHNDRDNWKHYNYALSSIIMLKHYIDNPVILVLILFVLFVFSINSGLLSFADTIQKDFLTRYYSFDNDSTLWLIRGILFMALSAAIALGYYLSCHGIDVVFDLEVLGYVLLLPIFACNVLNGFKCSNVIALSIALSLGILTSLYGIAIHKVLSSDMAIFHWGCISILVTLVSGSLVTVVYASTKKRAK